MTMALDITFPAIAFVVAFVAGTLGWIAKGVWKNKQLTQTFAVVAIISTLALMVWGFVYLE